MTERDGLVERLRDLSRTGFGYDLDADDKDVLLKAADALSAAQRLVEKWRAIFPASACKSSDDYYAGQANGTLKCSDQLAALLSERSPR